MIHTKTTRFPMTILMRMLGLENEEYKRKEPSVVTAMRKVTGRWDDDDQKSAETKKATNDVSEIAFNKFQMTFDDLANYNFVLTSDYEP